MANLTQTLKAQTVREFGPSPSTKWGNTFKWTAAGVGPGNGTWGIKSAGSLGSIPIIKNIFEIWTKTNATPVTGFTNITKNQNKVFNKLIFSTYSSPDRELTDGADYYIFNDRTTNIYNRFFPSYSSAVASVTSTTGYISNAVVTTNWS